MACPMVFISALGYLVDFFLCALVDFRLKTSIYSGLSKSLLACCQSSKVAHNISEWSFVLWSIVFRCGPSAGAVQCMKNTHLSSLCPFLVDRRFPELAMQARTALILKSQTITLRRACILSELKLCALSSSILPSTVGRAMRYTLHPFHHSCTLNNCDP
jgi:hypothetical protein